MKKRVLYFLIGMLFVTFLHAQTKTTLSGTVENLKADSIKLALMINDITRQSQVIKLPVVKGRFTTELHITQPAYIYTTDGVNYVSGLLEPGDHTEIFYDSTGCKNTLRFAGKGKEKFEYMLSFKELEIYKKLPAQTAIAVTKRYPFDHMIAFTDSVERVYTQKLSEIKPFMVDKSYRLLIADLKAAILGAKNHAISTVYHESAEEILEKRQAELTPSSKVVLQNITKFDNTLSYSQSYINTIFTILFRDYDSRILRNKAGKDLLEKYEYLTQQLSAEFKIPVLTLFLDYDISKLNQSEDLETLIDKIYTSAKDSTYRKYITTRYKDITSFKTGMSAPDFVLQNEKGEKVSLASFKGKVVFLDFWYEACGPCHALFQNIKSLKEKYKNDSVVFLTVSIDKQDVWENSLKKNNIPGYHVFTENRESSHPVIKAYKIYGYPTTCLIDKNGKIFLATPSNNPEELDRQINNALSINIK